MDESQFDALARSLAAPPSRRRLLTGLAALPVVGGLLGLFGPDDAEAGGGRRKRRKKRHKRAGRRRQQKKDRGQGKQRRKPTCTPDAKADTCEGTCGPVVNNCGETVACGSCVCEPACPVCQTCDEDSGDCIADPEQIGDSCGPAQTCVAGTVTPRGACNAAGVCEAATPVDCAPYVCAGDACATSCAGDGDCVSGYACNADAQCEALRANGAGCSRDGVCASGHCADGVCCSTACDGVCQACNLADSVGTCAQEADGAACGSGFICCAGGCINPTDPANCGACGNVCTGALTACAAGVCGCPAGSKLCGGFCVPESCGPGGVLNDNCNCVCRDGNVTCVPGAVCIVESPYCLGTSGWELCGGSGSVSRRRVPPCPAGQTLDQATCLCVLNAG